MNVYESKLNDLLEIEGMDVQEAMEEFQGSVVTGICMNEDCFYTTDVEPDNVEGYCEDCGTNTVHSVVDLLLYVV